ncbi:unnamed protein product, partial [Iphiclides podalirius]
MCSVPLSVLAVFGVALVTSELYGENLDEPCEVEEAGNIPGKCTPDYKCEYAEKLINEEEKKPTDCFNNGTYRLVCCPIDIYQTGVLGRTFMDSQDGKLTDGELECRYTGDFPMVCCKRQPIVTTRKPEINDRSYLKCRDDQSTAAACDACYTYSEPRLGMAVCPQNTVPKIAYGEIADIEEFPHMTILGCRKKKVDPNDPDIAWIGAGTLISPLFVLTAAHVLFDPSK